MGPPRLTRTWLTIGLLRHLLWAVIETCLKPPLALTPRMVQLLHPRQATPAQMLPEQVTQNNPHLIQHGQDVTVTHYHRPLLRLTLAIVAAPRGYVAANLHHPPSPPSEVCLVIPLTARLHRHLRTVLKIFIAPVAEVQVARHMLQSKCFPQPQLRTLIFSQVREVLNLRYLPLRQTTQLYHTWQMKSHQLFPRL